MTNDHNQSIPQEVLDQVKAKLNEVNALIKPYGITLTAVQRHSMLKKGDRSDSFVNKSFEYAKTNPEFIPSFLNMSEFEVDITDANNLIGVSSVATQIANTIDDTMMVSGSEAYYAALAYYNNVQQAMSMNIPGAKAIYEELKKRFPGGARKTDNSGSNNAQ